MRVKYLVSMILSFLVTLGLIAPVYAAPKQVDTNVTKFSFLNKDKVEANKIYHSDDFYLDIDWDASSSGTNLQEGDYFDITLPDKMIFPSDSPYTDFKLYADDGKTVMANAHVDPKESGGGKVRITFTDYVNDKYDVKGNIFLTARFVREEVNTNEDNSFSITVNGEVTTHNITVVGPTDITDETLAKWGYKDDDPQVANWEMRINHSKYDLDNTVITDNLGDSGETYIEGSITLDEVTYDSKGGVLSREKVDITDKLTLSEDKTSFTLNMGDITGKQYSIRYKTTYTPGTTLTNSAVLKSGDVVKDYKATYRSTSTGGTGSGSLANKIKIIKVDAENKETKLEGAEFTLKNEETGKTYTLTTDKDGEVTSDKLVSGKYTIEETKAPTGYIKNGEKVTVEVKDGEAVVKTITNEPLKTNIKVVKKWIGEKKDSVTVKLLANGEVKDEITLNNENEWTHLFENLREYKNGKKISYSVEEVEVEGYSTKITGNEKDGFEITNTKKQVTGIEEENPITVTENETPSIVNEIEKTKVSKNVVETGDQTRVLMILILFIVSAGLLVFVLRKIKK
ncbi:Ig-like domain-containing protein [Kandleria sp.]|uniref:Ig-like domain-containing protein n=1 Tax=Kandleria sp. TaxID=2774291 RepID=UPI001B5A376D|nr:Ig-like domain-containing protein [Kandleria sp.]MBP3275226.1 Cna B-type domain-containing protein [Kandleria sp.]